MSPGPKRRIREAQNRVEREISGYVGDGDQSPRDLFIRGGLSREGYAGGYADALADVLAVLNGVPPSRRPEYWR